MPLIPTELVALGTAFSSGIVQMTLPLLLRVGLGAQPPAVQGMAVGAAAHVGGMAALTALGHQAAADAAAVALVVFGVARAVSVHLPGASTLLSRACGAEEREVVGSGRAGGAPS